MQYGAIKVLPGLVGLTFVPFLFGVMGPDRFGQYSLAQGLGLLIASVLGAVVTQPMYRFLSSDQSELPRFAAAACAASALGGLVAGLLATWIADSLLTGALVGALAGSVVVFGVAGVYLQILGRVPVLALMELARVGVLVAVTVLLVVTVEDFGVDHALAGLCVSFAAPVLPLVRRVPFKRFDLLWVRARLGYGLLGAVWLTLAGLPLLGSKLALEWLGEDLELGLFSAVADFSYRAFGLLNAAITMTVFPAVARAFDRGEIGEARRQLRFGLWAYLAGSCAALLGGLLAVGSGLLDPLFQTHGFVSPVLIFLACCCWQLLSVAHKPDELRLRMDRVVFRMVTAMGTFVLVAGSGLALSFGSRPSIPLALGILAGAAVYLASSRSTGLVDADDHAD